MNHFICCLFDPDHGPQCNQHHRKMKVEEQIEYNFELLLKTQTIGAKGEER